MSLGEGQINNPVTATITGAGVGNTASWGLSEHPLVPPKGSVYWFS